MLYKSWPSIIVAPAATGSGIYRVQQSMQDDGTYDGVLVYECGASTGSVEFGSLSTLFRSGSTILYKSWGSPVTAPVATGSGIYRVQQSLQDDGTYDAMLVYEFGTAQGKAPFASLRSVTRKGSTILYRSWPTIIQAPEASGSGIYRVQQSLQDDGTYDAALLYECGSGGLTHEFRSLGAFTRLGSTVLYKSWPSPILAPDAGQGGVYRAQQSLNDDGSYDGALVYEADSEQQVTITSLKAKLKSRTTSLYSNRSSAVSSNGSAVQGIIYSASSRINENGLYDAQSDTEQNEPAAIFKAWSTTNGACYQYVYKNWLSTITVSLDSYNVSHGSIINDDGTYDTVINITPDAGGGGSDFDDTENAKAKLTGLHGSKGVGNYIVYLYFKKTWANAATRVAAKLAVPTDPDTGYIVVPSYGAYHTGVWIRGAGKYEGVVVLYKA